MTNDNFKDQKQMKNDNLTDQSDEPVSGPEYRFLLTKILFETKFFSLKPRKDLHEILLKTTEEASRTPIRINK
jgi:hypothetical protein